MLPMIRGIGFCPQRTCWHSVPTFPPTILPHPTIPAISLLFRLATYPPRKSSFDSKPSCSRRRSRTPLPLMLANDACSPNAAAASSRRSCAHGTCLPSISRIRADLCAVFLQEQLRLQSEVSSGPLLNELFQHVVAEHRCCAQSEQ